MNGPIRLPDLTDEHTAPYWEGFEEGEIRVPRCQDCDEYVWYPRTLCPNCQSKHLAWTDVGPRARLFTWVGVDYHFNIEFLQDRVPLITGIIEPDAAESVRLVALVDEQKEDVEIGMPLEAQFLDGNEGITWPVYRSPD